MNDKKTDRADWNASDNLSNAEAAAARVEEFLAATDEDQAATVGSEVSQTAMPIAKAILAANMDDALLLAEEIRKNPESRVEYEKLMKSGSAGPVVRKQTKNLADMVLSMMIDPEIQRDTVENYSFPHQRVMPVLLRRAGASVAPQMIKTYRYHQLAEFAQVSDGKNAGFNLVFTDKDRKATKKEQATIANFEQVFAKRFFWVPNEAKPNLSKFLRYAYQDFFDLDKVAIEIVRTRGSLNEQFNFRGSPLGWQLVDGATIHHVLPKFDRVKSGMDDWRWDRKDYKSILKTAGLLDKEYIDEARYIQVDRHQERKASYTEEMMILSHAFGTTDVQEQHQGYSIIEKSLEILRYIVDSIIYNYTRRSTGTMPKGMIVIEGATEDGFSREEMELFRKLIWGIASGRKDHWKYPVLGTPKGVKPEFIRFHESSKEMEDFLWVSTLFSILCSFAGMDPENISLASQKNTLGKQKLFSKTEEEGVQYRSQDEGLRFFLNYIKEIINCSEVVEELTGIDGIQWDWTGLDVEDEVKKKDLQLKGLETTESLNDLLVAADKKEVKLMAGDVNIYDLPGAANPQFLQLITAALQAKQQEDMGMFPGEENGGPGPDYIGGEEFPNPDAGNGLKPGQPAAKPSANGKPKPGQPKERRTGGKPSQVEKAMISITIVEDDED